jgi:hypothetical protein
VAHTECLDLPDGKILRAKLVLGFGENTIAFKASLALRKRAMRLARS